MPKNKVSTAKSKLQPPVKKAPVKKTIKKVKKSKAPPKSVKIKKVSKSKASQLPKLFLLRKSDQWFLIPETMVEAMPPEEAFQLAIQAHVEQRKQLMLDAQLGDHYVHNMKIVDGLELSLSKLETLFPTIRSQVLMLEGESKVGQA